MRLSQRSFCAEKDDIRTRLHNDLVQAMKAKEKEKMSIIRGLNSKITYHEKESGKAPTNADVAKVLVSALKEAQETEGMYRSHNRLDKVERELQTIDIVKSYLPDLDLLRSKVEEIIKEVGATSMKDMKQIRSGMADKGLSPIELAIAQPMIADILVPKTS